jgi:hypothetical protein
MVIWLDSVSPIPMLESEIMLFSSLSHLDDDIWTPQTEKLSMMLLRMVQWFDPDGPKRFMP